MHSPASLTPGSCLECFPCESRTSNCLKIAFQFLQDWWTAPVSSFRSLLVSFPRLLLTILIPMERVRVDLVFFTGLHQRVFTFIRYNVSTNFSCVCPGEAPFAEILANELLQFHQRGKNLKKPSNCSNTLWVSTAILQKRQTWSATLPLVNHRKSQINFFISSSHRYTIIKGCCQWKDQERPTLAEVRKKLASGEKAASDKVIKASGTVNIEQYLQEAGYGEANSYTVFWLQLSSAKALLRNKKKWRSDAIQ